MRTKFNVGDKVWFTYADSSGNYICEQGKISHICASNNGIAYEIGDNDGWFDGTVNVSAVAETKDKIMRIAIRKQIKDKEISISSYTAHIKELRKEIEELKKQIKELK